LKPAPFAYAKARSVAHAIELLASGTQLPKRAEPDRDAQYAAERRAE
jgi:hypothetical protein